MLGASIQEAAARDVEVINQELRALCKDGTYRWLLGSYRPVIAEGVLYGMAVDITERKAIEAALQDREQRTRAILDTAYEAFISIDEVGRITEWNMEAERVFGWHREEAIGRRVADLILPPRYRAAHVAGLANYRATGDAPILGKRIEIEALRKDGSEFPIELTISPLPTGSTVVFNAFLRDITARKRAESALGLAKAQAEMASAAAERASRAKSEFLSGMSHELRTPLNAILGFAQLLQLDELSGNRRESVEQIVRAGEHLLRLIDELLDVARIEHGTVPLSIEPVLLEDVLTGALELVRPMASIAGVQLSIETSQFNRYARADDQRLRQVIMNLLSNAIKYNRRGGSVTITCEALPPDRLKIAVADTGPGIPSDQIPRLFLPFERLGAERSSVEGTGIGLSICKRLVELMGGTIGVHSETGRGSTFWVELSATDAPDIEDLPLASALPVRAPTSELTVLYVEDNLSNLRLVERILESRPNTRLIAAMQGQLALDLAREHDPDLILLDVHLPDINGDEVLRRLQADRGTHTIPVVAVSAEANPSKIKRFLAAGAHAYLTKPLRVNELLAVVDGIADRRAKTTAETVTASQSAADRVLEEEVIAPLRELHNKPPGGRMADLAALYITETTGRVAELQDAVSAGDSPLIERLAHALRGASASFGARHLPELCGRLERLASSDELGGAQDLLDVIAAEFELVAAALRQEFAAT